MSRARLWVERIEQFEGTGGVFMLSLQSGDETLRFAMSPHIAGKLCAYGAKALRDWERDPAPIIAFAKGE